MSDQPMLFPIGRERTGQRRLDWRLLLPAPEGRIGHLALFGGSERMAERLVSSGTVERVSLDPPAGCTADAVARLHNSRAGIREVAAALAPGGAVYFEVDRRSASGLALTPGRLAGWMAGAGLAKTGIYWAAPDLDHCKRLIPLDHPGPIQWYFSTLFLAGTPLLTLLEGFLRLLTRFDHHRFLALAPCYAITAVGPLAETTLPMVLAHPELPDEFRDPGVYPIVITSDIDDGSRTTVLPFDTGRLKPLAVLKISTHSGLNDNTLQEQVQLNEVRKFLSGSMCATIPRPLGLYPFGHFLMGVESYMDGLPLAVTSGRWLAHKETKIADLHLAADWLKAFHLQTEISRAAWDRAAIERWIETPISEYETRYGVIPQESRLFEKVRKHADSLIGASFPLVRVHYDFGPWNLYRSQQGLNVIDWEYGRDWENGQFGPSLYDLLYFVTYWVHLAYRAIDFESELCAFHAAFVDPDLNEPFAKAVHSVLSEHAVLHRIDRRLIPLIFVYVLLEQALHRDVRKRKIGSVNGNARMNNRRVVLLDFLATHADKFFATMNGESRA